VGYCIVHEAILAGAVAATRVVCHGNNLCNHTVHPSVLPADVRFHMQLAQGKTRIGMIKLLLWLQALTFASAGKSFLAGPCLQLLR
jgi:hypothetical protein